MTDDTTDLFVLNVVFLVAASALAIVLTSCLWNHIHPEPHSVLTAALASFRLLAPPKQQQQQQQQQSTASPPQDESSRKSTRSKERRRRGKDPIKDLFKGGKKSRALLKAIRATDHDHHAHPDDGLLHASEPGNDSASSPSREHSPSRDHLVPEVCAESDDGNTRAASPNSFASISAVASSGDLSDHGSSDASSRADHNPCPPVSHTPTDTAADASDASMPVERVSINTPSSPPHDADIRTPQPRDHEMAPPKTESCAKLIRARTRLRVAKIDSGIMPRLFSSALPDNMASSSSSIPSAASCPSLYITSSTHSTDGAGPSTPTNPRGSTPPPRPRSSTGIASDREPNAQPLDQDAVSAQVQLASLHGALEAAHAREEQLRIEAEQASKECDELRWKWNEDVGVWRRREAELHAQIHHLMQQLQAYAAVASFQAQQASTAPVPTSSFSSPASPHVQHPPLPPFPLPPTIQAQNSASPPAHVQALLASAPMLTYRPPGFAAHVSGAVYSGTGCNGMSPLMWSGMGLCVPNRDARRASDSSASGSSSRGRRRRRRVDDVQSASDESSSLGELDGVEDEEEDIFRNNALADAILKRPESIRGLGGKGRGRPPMHENGNGAGLAGVGTGERMDGVKDPALEHSGVVQPLAQTDRR